MPSINVKGWGLGAANGCALLRCEQTRRIAPTSAPPASAPASPAARAAPNAGGPGAAQGAGQLTAPKRPASELTPATEGAGGGAPVGDSGIQPDSKRLRTGEGWAGAGGGLASAGAAFAAPAGGRPPAAGQAHAPAAAAAAAAPSPEGAPSESAPPNPRRPVRTPKEVGAALGGKFGFADSQKVVRRMVDEILSSAKPGSAAVADALVEFFFVRIAKAPGREMTLNVLCPKAHFPGPQMRRLMPGAAFDLQRFLADRPREFVLARRGQKGTCYVSLRGATTPRHDEPEPRGFSLQLPRPLGLPPLEVRLSTPDSLADDLAWLQESFTFDLGEGVCEQLRGWGGGMAADLGLRPGALLGVDAESVGGVTSLVQLATGRRACLFRFKPCCAEPAARFALAALMADPAVGKVGVELTQVSLSSINSGPFTLGVWACLLACLGAWGVNSVDRYSSVISVLCDPVAERSVFIACGRFARPVPGRGFHFARLGRCHRHA